MSKFRKSSEIHTSVEDVVFMDKQENLYPGQDKMKRKNCFVVEVVVLSQYKGRDLLKIKVNREEVR